MQFDVYSKNMFALMESKYPRVNLLEQPVKDMIVKQLSWVQENTQYTPQSDVIYNKLGGQWQQHLHREILRALSRIECMLLLHQVNDENFNDSYTEFTAEQSEQDKLSKDSFRKLSEQFIGLQLNQIDTQIRASLIAAVTLSPEAIKQTEEKLGKGNFPYDSVMFSGRTVSVCGELYPAYQLANEDVRTMLRACFPDDNRHWRHAFFLENSGCLDALKKQVANCNPEDKDRLKIEVSTWLSYWLVNALGFNGHAGDLRGSSFLTESVFQRTVMLNKSIENFIDNPSFDVFQKYSSACLDFLGITISNPDIAILIVRTLNMANLFNKDAAKSLEKHIRDNQLLEMAEHHSKVFKSGRVATYLPAFLQNVYAVAKEGEKFKELLSAIDWASTVIEKSNVSIVSFRLMDKKNVQQLIDSGFRTDILVDNKGEVNMPPKMLPQLK